MTGLTHQAIADLDARHQGEGPDQELLRARAWCRGSTRARWSRRSTGSRRSSPRTEAIAEANTRVLKAGRAFGETAEIFDEHYIDRGRPRWRRASTGR